MIKKIISLWLIVLIITTFSSCQSRPSTSAVKTETKPVELTFWNLFDDSDVFKGQIQAYQSKHRNVKITYKKFTNIDEYESLLINEIAEGEGPDIFAIQNDWVNKHQKKIAPFPVGKTTLPLNPQIFEETFFHVATTDLVKENQIYGIPLSIDSLALYYNKQIFRDNVPNSDKPAETWEEIKKQSQMITKENNSVEKFSVAGIAIGRADNINRAVDIFNSLLLQYEVQFFSDDQKKAIFAQQHGTISGTGNSYFPFLESLKFYTSFGINNANDKDNSYCWNQYITSSATAENINEINPFLMGKVGMIFGYSYLYQDLISMRKQMKTVGDSVINENDIGVIEFPQILSFAETGKRDAFANYFPLTVSRNSPNIEIAWDFIQYLSAPESLSDYHQKTNKPTSLKKLVDEQMVEPIYGVFARQASYAKSIPLINEIDGSFLRTVFIRAIQESLQKKKKLSTISEEAQKKVNCQIEKQGKLGEVSVDCLNI